MDGALYTTIGATYDFIVEKHNQTGLLLSFPLVLSEMKSRGLLSATVPEFPSFHAGMTAGEFTTFLRGHGFAANQIIAGATSFQQDKTISENAIFPPGKDVGFLLNMPYMADYPHYHPYFEITYVVKGECHLLFGNEDAWLYEGDLCIVSPMSAHSIPIEPGCIAVSFIVRQSTFDKAFGNLLSKQDLLSLFFRNSLYANHRANYVLLRTKRGPLVFATVQDLAYECSLDGEDANTCAAILLNLLLTRAVRAANTEVTLHHYEGYSEKDLDFTLILKYIQANYATVSLASLAGVFNFSETYLSRLIQKKMNQSFTELLATLKMNHAAEYLANTTQKVGEIAKAVGYDSVDHFTRTFRRTFGVTPREYRRG